MTKLIYLIEHPSRQKFLPDKATFEESGYENGLKVSEMKEFLINDGYEMGNLSIDHVLVDFIPIKSILSGSQLKPYGTIIRHDDNVIGAMLGYDDRASLEKMIRQYMNMNNLNPPYFAIAHPQRFTEVSTALRAAGLDVHFIGKHA